MNNSTTEELQLYFARIKPIYREMFGMAHAICGNYESAEYVLQQVVLEGWTRHDRIRRRVGFREGMRAALKRAAVQEALKPRQEEQEQTWNGLVPDAMDDVMDDGLGVPEDALVLHAVHGESLEMRRMLMMRHGCGLRPQTIAKVMGATAEQVQDQLERFETRLRHSLPARLRRHCETILARVIRDDLVQGGGNVPDPGTVYRTFEVEASQARSPRKYISRAVSIVVFAVLALLCAMVFWLVAVLMQAPQIESANANLPSVRIEKAVLEYRV